MITQIHTQELIIGADAKQWYKDAIIYELHVRSFYDDDGDGVGDFKGLIKRLDYLRDLGVTALWLLPFYPSPLRDDGYDIANYERINPSYGNMRDFRRFLREAHNRGLRVITELVINHTSTEHPWFQRARRAPEDSNERNFYVWTDDPNRYSDARIIFKDFETSNWSWDPVANAYYWHRFYSHQPDLNFENPHVQQAVFETLDFWMNMGVDGLRLDAIPYLFEREGTSCENLPETHAFLKKLRAHIDDRYEDRVLLAEANQWPEDAVAYFGDGDECHMCFHFPLMPRLFMSVQLENSFPIHDILEQTPAIPPTCQWALFLRNHDELTLEMVTDEDRDYMYRVYAADPQTRINMGIRRRLAPLLRSRRKVELLNALLMSMPGTPVLYYGDELGMGDNVYLGDRNSVRTPMQWSADRNAGFSRANPQRLFLPPIADPEYHYEAINVEAQQDNPSSLLWWTKRIIALRKQMRVFGRGTVEFLQPENGKVLAFIRSFEDETVLVVANLSRFVQCVELDLSRFQGMIPVELFGRTEFPTIGTDPYFLTLGPHSFYWFCLEHAETSALAETGHKLPLLCANSGLLDLVDSAEKRVKLKRAIANFIVRQRWYRGGSEKRKGISIVECIPLAEGETLLLLVEILFVDSPAQTYVLPVTFFTGTADAGRAHGVIAELEICSEGGVAQTGLLIDAAASGEFVAPALELSRRSRRVTGRHGRLVGVSLSRASKRFKEQELLPGYTHTGQASTCVICGEHLVLKLFRVLEDGVNPDLEISRFLSQNGKFPHSPRVTGAIEYLHKQKSVSVAMVQRFVPNRGTAAQVWGDALQRYCEQLLTRRRKLLEQVPSIPNANQWRNQEVPPLMEDLFGAMLPQVRLMAERVAMMHKALGSDVTAPEFTPEPFTRLHRRSLYQSTRSRTKWALDLLKRRKHLLSDGDRAAADALIALRSTIDKRVKRVIETAVDGYRMRIHGDLRLEQLLDTGKDFVVIDFDGDANRALAERMFKRSPLRDVVALLRSFHRQTDGDLRGHLVRTADLKEIDPWVLRWRRWLSVAFLNRYFEVARSGGFLSTEQDIDDLLLEVYLIDQCMAELARDLSSDLSFVGTALRGILEWFE